jgi:two-component system NarL family sensor kinase
MWKYWQILVSHLKSVPLWLKITGIQVLPILIIAFAMLFSVKNFLITTGNQASLPQDVHNLIVNLSITIGVALTGSVIVAYLLSLVLIHPTKQVLSAIHKVEMGDFSARVGVWSQDEIGQMLKAFNNMIEELQVIQSTLIHRNWQLTSVNELAESVTVGKGTDAVIESALKRVVTTMESDFGAIYLYAPGTLEPQLKAIHGEISPNLLEMLECSNSGRELLQKVCETGHALVIQDNQADPSSTEDDFSLVLQGDFNTWVCSPLKVEGEVIGFYHLGRRKGRPNIYYDTALLEVVGNVVGVNLSNAQLLKDLRQKESELRRALHRSVEVTEDERKRLARELHDEIGQALTSILIQLKTVQEEKDVKVIINRIDSLRQLTSQTIEELRRLAMDLRPAALDSLGIAAALRWHARQCSERTGVKIIFSEPDYPDRLPSHIELILYRIAQEGINNAIRHGNATQILLGLEVETSMVRLSIYDNGKGFHENERYSGLGLVGIRERVELLQGHFSLDSSPGSGTNLLIEIPVPIQELRL